MTNKLINKTKGQATTGVFGFVILVVLVVLIITNIISDASFNGAVGTIMDILPIALAGLAIYFIAFAFR